MEKYYIEKFNEISKNLIKYLLIVKSIIRKKIKSKEYSINLENQSE
jgi:hypothetical protein